MIRAPRTLAAACSLLWLVACGDSGNGPDFTLDPGASSVTDAGTSGSSIDSSVAPASADSGTQPSTLGGTGALGGGSPGGGSVSPSGDSGTQTVDAGTPGKGAGDNDGGASSDDSGSTPSGGGFIRGPAPTSDSASKDGPYKVGNTTSGFRDGPNFAEATLWWPEDADPPFAITAVVPGWVSTEADIRDWGPFLASHGIVTLTIGTNDPAGDLPPDRAAALLDALETLRDENTREGGPLNGKLDVSRQATMGWSMGGGGTLLAAEQTPTLKATISMCGWNPGYSYDKVTVPALLFASEGDPLAGGQSQGFYESIPDSTPKELWEVPGGDHFGFNTPKNQDGAVGRYGLSWLKVFLEGDERYKQFLKEMPSPQTDFRNNL